jgi:glycine/D-amino acid oxidase-like deaminating enzyme
MKTSTYDIAIVGSGPIGAATAYFLRDSGKSVAVISAEPSETGNEHMDTYKYAGGSVRWYFEDPQVTAQTLKTANFILDLKDKGVDLSIIENGYVFLHKGISVPSINLSGAKLVGYLLSQATASGSITHIQSAFLQKYQKDGEEYVLETTQGKIRAKKVLLALGAQLPKFVPEAGYEYEKREVLVLDLPVEGDRAKFPHTIASMGSGIVYVFVKQTANGMRMLIGQEGVIETDEVSYSGRDYLQELKDKGILNIFPFLKDAQVENVLWGFDAKNKVVKIYTPDDRLFAASCGSAIRSCIAIGEEVAKALLN